MERKGQNEEETKTNQEAVPVTKRTKEAAQKEVETAHKQSRLLGWVSRPPLLPPSQGPLMKPGADESNATMTNVTQQTTHPWKMGVVKKRAEGNQISIQRADAQLQGTTPLENVRKVHGIISHVLFLRYGLRCRITSTRQSTI